MKQRSLPGEWALRRPLTLSVKKSQFVVLRRHANPLEVLVSLLKELAALKKLSESQRVSRKNLAVLIAAISLRVTLDEIEEEKVTVPGAKLLIELQSSPPLATGNNELRTGSRPDGPLTSKGKLRSLCLAQDPILGKSLEERAILNT
ncbi:hypothetical protein C0Q70_16533 [Pomacea canaliculata]|uniref:Uncharacterized protein n=1 Tax=Pomacea canaliculata TaxID=400727 RepID=A0A2T7NQ21_POMCA|nr:hypothetical protein C0Q70_16533 [Pomacea canaliculata]